MNEKNYLEHKRRSRLRLLGLFFCFSHSLGVLGRAHRPNGWVVVMVVVAVRRYVGGGGCWWG